MVIAGALFLDERLQGRRLFLHVFLRSHPEKKFPIVRNVVLQKIL